jgi:NAD(P)-dependent dehydrogenase (short-subunit alcohol dehydrogenase family)
MRVCIVGASGKLGQYMVQHALDRGYEVVGVCREQSAAKLDGFTGRITVIPGATDDREVIRTAVAGCDGVLTVLVPRGVHVVRGSELEEGESQGLPVWSRHVGDPILASNITRRVDFALFMVTALENDSLIHEAPAIVGCRTPSALAHADDASQSAGP